MDEDSTIPPITHPKPKPKGKKPSSSKKKQPPNIKKIDLFKIFFGFDSGADTQQELNQSYFNQMKKMSQPKLSKLERKINRIKKKELSSAKKTCKSRQDVCDWLILEMEQMARRSADEEVAIQLKIKSKLDDLNITGTKISSSGKLEKIQLKGELVSIRKFINTFFSYELAQVKKLLLEGVLIPKHKQHGNFAIVKRYISDYLK